MTRLPNYLAEASEQWRHVDQAWHQTRAGWRDSVGLKFETHEWAPMEAQVRAYLSAFSELIECIEELEAEIGLAT